MQSHFAEIAQLVEHDLAKVGVASSSLVFRSKKRQPIKVGVFGWIRDTGEATPKPPEGAAAISGGG